MDRPTGGVLTSVRARTTGQAPSRPQGGVQFLNGSYAAAAMTSRHTSPASALQERLRSLTEAELAAGYTSPLIHAPGAGLPLHMWTGTEPPRALDSGRTCSRGCHSLPASANFDPHTGEPLSASAGPRRHRPKLVLRTV